MYVYLGGGGGGVHKTCDQQAEEGRVDGFRFPVMEYTGGVKVKLILANKKGNQSVRICDISFQNNLRTSLKIQKFIHLKSFVTIVLNLILALFWISDIAPCFFSGICLFGGLQMNVCFFMWKWNFMKLDK